MNALQSEPRLMTMVRNKSERHLHTYVHRRWSAQQKLSVIRGHNEFMLGFLTGKAFEEIYQGYGLTVETIDETWTLKLERSRYCKEGEQGIYIRNQEGRIVFGLTFCMDREDNAIYIGSLQGGKHSTANEDIKAFYRACHNTRPFELLMCAIYAFKETLAVRSIYGIPARFANNYGHGHKIRLDYDGYWKNIGGVLNGGWYRLPDSMHRKDVMEVKSKHRSMYRRRMLLMDHIHHQMQCTLGKAARITQLAC